MNEDVAKIDAIVRIRGTIRKKQGGKFSKYPYYVASTDFGNLFFSTDPGQGFIIENMQELSDMAIEETPAEPAQPDKPAEKIEPAPAKKKRGMFDDII